MISRKFQQLNKALFERRPESIDSMIQTQRVIARLTNDPDVKDDANRYADWLEQWMKS